MPRQIADSLAPKYAAFTRYSFEALTQIVSIVEAFLPMTVSTLLDVGCGDGVPASLIAHRMPHLRIGLLDLSDLMLQQARLRCVTPHRFWFVAGDTTCVPLAAGSVDAAFSCCMIHLVDDRRAFLANIRRVLRTEGEFILAFTSREDLSSQLVHRLFPGFNHAEALRHPSASEAADILMSDYFTLSERFRIPFEVSFPNRAAMLAFVASRPFFGLRRYTEDEFERAFSVFSDSACAEFRSEGVITSPSALTVLCGRCVE